MFAGSAAPFEGRALRCSTLVRYRLRTVSFGGRCARCAFARRSVGPGTFGMRLRGNRTRAIFLRCPMRGRAKDLLRHRSETMRSARVVRRSVEAGAFGAHLRSTVHCSPRALRRAKEAGKLHRFAAFPPHSLLRIHLFARCYSSASRHSKRVDARFARRTVYRPPSGELVMVLMR